MPGPARRRSGSAASGEGEWIEKVSAGMRGKPLNLYVCSVQVGEQIGFKIGSADKSPVGTRGWRMSFNGQSLVVTEEQCCRGLVAPLKPRQSGELSVLALDALFIRALLRFPHVEGVLNSDTRQPCRDIFLAPLAAIQATLAACMATCHEVSYAGGTVYIYRLATSAQDRSAHFIDVFASEASGPRSAAAAWMRGISVDEPLSPPLPLMAVGDAPSTGKEDTSSADEAPLVPGPAHTIVSPVDLTGVVPRSAGCPAGTQAIMDAVPASCPPTPRGNEAPSSPDGRDQEEEDTWATGVLLATRFLDLQVVAWRSELGPPSIRRLIVRAFRSFAARWGWTCTMPQAKKALEMSDLSSVSAAGNPLNRKYLSKQYAVYKRGDVVVTLKTETLIKSESDPGLPSVKSEPLSEPGPSVKRSPSGSPHRGFSTPTVEGKRARASSSSDHVLRSPDLSPLSPTAGLDWMPGDWVSVDNVTLGGEVLSGRRFVVLKFDAGSNKYVLADCETDSQYLMPSHCIRTIDGAVGTAADDTVLDGELGMEQRAEMLHGRAKMNNYAYFLRAMRKMGSDEQWLALDKRDRTLGHRWLGEDVMYYCNLRQSRQISEDMLNELLDQELQHVMTMLLLKKPDDEELERQEERAVDKVWANLLKKRKRARRLFPPGWIRPFASGV